MTDRVHCIPAKSLADPKPPRARPSEKAAKRDGDGRDLHDADHKCFLLVSKSVFERVARGIASDIAPDARFDPKAIESMQHAMEPFFVERFKQGYRIVNRVGRTALQIEGLTIVNDLCAK